MILEEQSSKMSNDQKFSVLMSVYDKEKDVFLDEAMKSILINQTRRPDEMVIVCDGPINESLQKVVQKYKDIFPNIIHIYRFKKNRGLGKALQCGLLKCSYDLVARADTDDICVPERFEKQIHYMTKHPNIAVLGSDIVEFDTDPAYPKTRKIMPKDNEGIRRMGKFRNPINHMTVVFRKEAVLKVGSYKDMRHIQDYDLWVRLMGNGYQMANLGEVLVYARVGNGMVSRRGSKNSIYEWKRINQYKLKKNLINPIEYLLNMIMIIIFINMPVGLKEFAYSKLLRK